jgi:hypothetical protein
MILQPRLVARAADDLNATHLPVFIASTTPFAVVALIFYCARIYSRLAVSMHLYWDDYFITLGVVRIIQMWRGMLNCQIATYLTWGVALALESVTGSKHIYFIEFAKIELGLKYFFVILFTSYYANLLLKASVGVMLLRIMQERAWRIGLWLMLALLFAIAIAVTTTNVMSCYPP